MPLVTVEWWLSAAFCLCCVEPDCLPSSRRPEEGGLCPRACQTPAPLRSRSRQRCPDEALASCTFPSITAPQPSSLPVKHLREGCLGCPLILSTAQQCCTEELCTTQWHRSQDFLTRPVVLDAFFLGVCLKMVPGFQRAACSTFFTNNSPTTVSPSANIN